MSVRQTGSSRFSRFYELADAGENVQVLDACDDAIWDQLRSGEVIDLGISLVLPDIVKSLGMLGSFRAFVPAFEALSTLPDEDGQALIDPEELRSVRGKLPVVEAAASAAEGSPVPIVAHLAAEPRYRVFMRLKRNALQTPELQDLEGDARLVATVQSKVAVGKVVDVGSPFPGLPAPNREQRRSGAGAAPSITLEYPSAIVTPIAIFR